MQICKGIPMILIRFRRHPQNVAAQVEDGVMVHQWHYGYSFGLQWGFKFMVLFLRMLILGALFLIMVLVSSCLITIVKCKVLY